MEKKCIKCWYIRNKNDFSPEYECPKCGVIYEKAEAAARRVMDSLASNREINTTIVIENERTTIATKGISEKNELDDEGAHPTDKIKYNGIRSNRGVIFNEITQERGSMQYDNDKPDYEMIECLNCKQKNMVKKDPNHLRPICGKCCYPLVKDNADTFEAKYEDSLGPDVTYDGRKKKNCPFCSELIHEQAEKCRFCGEWLNRKTVKEKANIALNEATDIVKNTKKVIESKKDDIGKYIKIFLFLAPILFIIITYLIEFSRGR